MSSRISRTQGLELMEISYSDRNLVTKSNLSTYSVTENDARGLKVNFLLSFVEEKYQQFFISLLESSLLDRRSNILLEYLEDLLVKFISIQLFNSLLSLERSMERNMTDLELPLKRLPLLDNTESI